MQMLAANNAAASDAEEICGSCGNEFRWEKSSIRLGHNW